VIGRWHRLMLTAGRAFGRDGGMDEGRGQLPFACDALRAVLRSVYQP
jgi:hypothetical protein